MTNHEGKWYNSDYKNNDHGHTSNFNLDAWSISSKNFETNKILAKTKFLLEKEITFFQPKFRAARPFYTCM